MNNLDTSAPRGGEPSLPVKVTSIHEALRAARIPHAIGGALALAYYAEPRATIDVDVNVFVSTDRWQEVIDALVELGVDAGKLDADALRRDGQCRIWWGDNAVDLFFANAEIHEAMRTEVRRVPFGSGTIPILARSTWLSARRCSTDRRTGSTSSRC